MFLRQRLFLHKCTGTFISAVAENKFYPFLLRCLWIRSAYCEMIVIQTITKCFLIKLNQTLSPVWKVSSRDLQQCFNLSNGPGHRDAGTPATRFVSPDCSAAICKAGIQGCKPGLCWCGVSSDTISCAFLLRSWSFLLPCSLDMRQSWIASAGN